MATIFHGQDLVEEPMVCKWKVGTGGSTTRTYKGTETLISNKALELQSLGYETDITTKSPLWELTATINIDLSLNNGNTEPEPIPQWELAPHIKDQTIFECQRPFVNGLSSDIRSCIENKLKNPGKENLFVVPEEITDKDTIKKAVRVFIYKQAGMDGRAINILSLTRSIIVSNRYNLTWSIVNSMKVISNYRLRLFDPPLAIVGILPNTYYANEYVALDASLTGITLDIPYYFGWLELHPTYQIAGKNRIKISQEWQYGKYTVGDNGLYDLVE